MQIETRTEKNVLILKLTGLVIMSSAGVMEQAILQALANGTARIVIDMTGVKHLDSMGVALLIRAMSSAKRIGGDLKLASVQPPVFEMVRLSNLDSVFDIRPSVADAIQAFEMST